MKKKYIIQNANVNLNLSHCFSQTAYQIFLGIRDRFIAEPNMPSEDRKVLVNVVIDLLNQYENFIMGGDHNSTEMHDWVEFEQNELEAVELKSIQMWMDADGRMGRLNANGTNGEYLVRLSHITDVHSGDVVHDLLRKADEGDRREMVYNICKTSQIFLDWADLSNPYNTKTRPNNMPTRVIRLMKNCVILGEVNGTRQLEVSRCRVDDILNLKLGINKTDSVWVR